MWRYSAVWVIPSVRQRWCPRPSCWGRRFLSLETLRFSGIFQGFLAWNEGLCVSYDVLKATVVVQWLSCVLLFAAHQASLFFTISLSLLKLMSIDSEMPSNHLIPCRSLLLPPVFPNIRVFSNESSLHIRWPNYWSFSFSISPSNEYSGLISFRIDCFDLLAVQGTIFG